MPKCCLYERSNGKRWKVCTTDAACPQILGDTLLGSWTVGDCDDCPESEPDPTVTVRPYEHPSQEFIEMLERAPLIIEKLKGLGFDPSRPPTLKK